MLSAEEVEQELVDYRAVVDDRDPMVRRALQAGVSKNRIHVLSGIARTTIDRIPKEPAVTTYTAEIGLSPRISLNGYCGVTVTPDAPAPGKGLDNVDTAIPTGQAGDMERDEIIDAAETVLAANGWAAEGDWVHGDDSYYVTVRPA